MNTESFVVKALAAILFCAFPYAVRGEELAVFATTATNHDVTRAVLDSFFQNVDGRRVEIPVYKPGKKVGTLDTGSKPLASIYKAGVGRVWPRLLGDGSTYILKSKSGASY